MCTLALHVVDTATQRSGPAKPEVIAQLAWQALGKAQHACGNAPTIAASPVPPPPLAMNSEQSAGCLPQQREPPRALSHSQSPFVCTNCLQDEPSWVSSESWQPQREGSGPQHAAPPPPPPPPGLYAPAAGTEVPSHSAPAMYALGNAPQQRVLRYAGAHIGPPPLMHAPVPGGPLQCAAYPPPAALWHHAQGSHGSSPPQGPWAHLSAVMPPPSHYAAPPPGRGQLHPVPPSAAHTVHPAAIPAQALPAQQQWPPVAPSFYAAQPHLQLHAASGPMLSQPAPAASEMSSQPSAPEQQTHALAIREPPVSDAPPMPPNTAADQNDAQRDALRTGLPAAVASSPSHVSPPGEPLYVRRNLPALFLDLSVCGTARDASDRQEQYLPTPSTAFTSEAPESSAHGSTRRTQRRRRMARLDDGSGVENTAPPQTAGPTDGAYAASTGGAGLKWRGSEEKGAGAKASVQVDTTSVWARAQAGALAALQQCADA